MSTLTNIDKVKLEKLFGMGSGYVMDFVNRSFSEFIQTSTQKDIWSEKYAYGSGSKANRLRAFWEQEPDSVVGKLLLEMLEYWKIQRPVKDAPIEPSEENLFLECKNIANRLLGKEQRNEVVSEDEFLNREFKKVSLEKLYIDGTITDVLKQRLDEIKKCLSAKAPLAAIFLCGSTLEGILLGIATKKPKEFNQATCAPTKNGKPLLFYDWSLAHFIDVAYSLKFIDEDVKKFSHALRDFRNYIHPYQQASIGFSPTEHTARICWQVLQAAIFQLSSKTL